MDKLKNFVQQHRQAFDDKEPDEKAWKEIEHAMQFSSRRTLWNNIQIWRAAAVIFMVLSVGLLLPKTLSSSYDKKVVSEVAMNEFNDVEAFYIQQISDKVEMIDEFKKNEGLNGFTHDFQQLEAMYLVLKEEMKTRPSKKVKDALVLNLLVRIDLLNQQLHRLEKQNVKEERNS